METKTAEDFLWGALLGGLIGAATALVLTPISGQALRKKIRNKIPYPEAQEGSHRLMRKRSIGASQGEKRNEGRRNLKASRKPAHQAVKAKPKQQHKKSESAADAT